MNVRTIEYCVDEAADGREREDEPVEKRAGHSADERALRRR